MYGMPQPANYAQYGFGGYAGFPGQAAAAPGSTGPGSPGMPQATNPGGAGLGLSVGGQQPGTETAAVQPGQPQWGANDPNYYSNYWGGEPFSYLLLWCLIFCQGITDRRLRLRLRHNSRVTHKCKDQHRVKSRFISSKILVCLLYWHSHLSFSTFFVFYFFRQFVPLLLSFTSILSCPFVASLSCFCLNHDIFQVVMVDRLTS